MTRAPCYNGTVSDPSAENAALRAQLDEMAGELLDRYEELTLLYDLGAALATRFEVADICEVAIDRAMRAVGNTKAAVALAGQGGVEVVASRDLPTVTPGGVTEYVARTGREVLLHEDELPPPGIERGHDRRMSVLSVPLVAPEGGDVLGALTLAAKPHGDFTAGDAKLATAIARQLAAALYTSGVVAELRAAEGVRRELEIAAEIQRALLPGSPPSLAGVRLRALCEPAANVGGDYYDLIVGADGRLSLVIADVAGHSIGSALLMAMARSILRREISEGTAPDGVLERTNVGLYDDLVAAGLFITAFCARYDPARGLLEYANAGHNRPMLRRADGSVEELDADGAALGILAAVPFEGLSVALGPGEALLLYTDGATEAAAPSGEPFGEERLSEAFLAGLPPAGLFERVREHCRGVAQVDDVTFVMLEREEP
jgi:serine phosphatase RsbU (regulator of sigma subunit)